MSNKRNFAGATVINSAGHVEGNLEDDMQVTMLGAGQEVSS